MARPQKQTVDYFPHLVGDSKTKFILESRYGNDGYAFWFKLLELLCKTDGHYYNCTGVSEWEYLLALTRVSESIAKDILDKLAEMDKIDSELWDQAKVIWCQSLVDNVADAYKKRTVTVPRKPCLNEFSNQKPEVNRVSGDGNPAKDSISDVSGDGNPQIKLNNTKVNNIDDDEERTRVGKVFEFFNNNISPIRPFQSDVITQHLNDGMESEMILEVFQDSMGKTEKWTWINTVLNNSAISGVMTLLHYQAKKKEKGESKTRDKPTAQTGSTSQTEMLKRVKEKLKGARPP